MGRVTEPKMKSWTIALMAAGAFAAGCGGDKSGASGAAPVEKIGIQACDDYIAKMDACLPKLSANEKTAMESFKDTREAWKAAAAKGGAEKDRLKPACEAALDPAIVRFSARPKPWDRRCRHPLAMLYWLGLARTPWTIPARSSSDA